MNAQFDSLAYTNRLKNAGVDEKQAEIQAEALLQVVNGQLLTKHDLREAKMELSQSIKGRRTELSQEIKAFEIKLVRRLRMLRQNLDKKCKKSSAT